MKNYVVEIKGVKKGKKCTGSIGCDVEVKTVKAEDVDDAINQVLSHYGQYDIEIGKKPVPKIDIVHMWEVVGECTKFSGLAKLYIDTCKMAKTEAQKNK